MTEYEKQKQKLLKEKEEILELYNKLLPKINNFILEAEKLREATTTKEERIDFSLMNYSVFDKVLRIATCNLYIETPKDEKAVDLLLNNMEFNLKIDSEKQKTIKKFYE